jgi:hypothetical protein
MSGIVSALLHVRLNSVSIRALFAAALAVCLIPIGTTQADQFWPRYGSWGWGDSKPFQQKHRRAQRKHEPAVPAADAAAGPARPTPTTEAAAPREAGEPPSVFFGRCNYATSASNHCVHEAFNWFPTSNNRTF